MDHGVTLILGAFRQGLTLSFPVGKFQLDSGTHDFDFGSKKCPSELQLCHLFLWIAYKKMMMMMNSNDNHGIVSKGRRRDVTNDPNLFSRPES